MIGSVLLWELHAPSLEGNPLGDPARRKMPVYLPPGYDRDARRYPTVYFLHGFTGSGLGWVNASAFGVKVPERLDALVTAGKVPPVIGVFVDGWTKLGGSQWMNSEAIGRYADYLARDVTAAVDRDFRTIADRGARAVIGHSSGGYGAYVMGRDHGDVFAHIAAHSADSAFEYCFLGDLPKAAAALLNAPSPEHWFNEAMTRARETKLRGEDHAVLNVLAMSAAYSPAPGLPLGVELPFDPATARLREDVWQRWLTHDPVRFVPRHLERFRRLESIFIDCGTRDEFNLRWGARMVTETLRQAGIAVHHEEFEDGHMGVSYRYDRSVTFLAPRLRTASG